jgi:PIN domain
MATIDEAVGQIVAVSTPVLLLDTCILLDVVRSTYRCLKNCAERALELVRIASTAPPECVVVISSVVEHEWTANAQDVTADVNRHYALMDEQYSHFHDACTALGIDVAFGPADYQGLGLAEKLRELSQRLLSKTLRLDVDDERRAKAVERVMKDLPPSRKRGQVQDCVIIEDYLALCRRLQSSGFTRKRVFCTSNTNDYCEPGRGLHPLLSAEFSACGLTFATNLPMAVHEITH